MVSLLLSDGIFAVVPEFVGPTFTQKMKPSNPIPPVVLTAAATVLQPYLPGLSPEILLDAIQTTSTKDIDKTEKTVHAS